MAMAGPGDTDSEMTEMERRESRGSTPVPSQSPNPQQTHPQQQTHHGRHQAPQTLYYTQPPAPVPLSPYGPVQFGSTQPPNTYPPNHLAYLPNHQPSTHTTAFTPDQLAAILQLINPQASTPQNFPSQQALALAQILQGQAPSAPFPNPFIAPSQAPQPYTTYWAQRPQNDPSQPSSRRTSSSSTGNVSTPQNQSRKNSSSSTAPETPTQSYATAPGPSRGKRKRTEAPPNTNPGQEQPKEQGVTTEALLAEQVAANRALMEMIQVQHRQTQEQLSIISQNTYHIPNRDQVQEPLLAQAEVLKGLLDGTKETNDLLRLGFTAMTETNGDVKPNIRTGNGGDANMGDSDDDDMEEEMPVRKKAKSGPTHRDRKDVALSRVFRRMFKTAFKGHVSNPGNAGSLPSMENFMLDLERPPGYPWNQASKKLFVNTLISSNVPEIVELDPSREALNRQFITNFRSARLRHAWSKLSDGEKKTKKQQARRKGRKRWLWYRRVRAAKRFEETKRHLPMLAAYGADGMSTDASSHENGTGQPIYKVMTKIWRHPNATACLRTLDHIHRDSRFAPIREVGPGAHAHNRVISDLKSSRHAVCGLPTGLYNPDWLKDKPPVFQQDLEIITSGEYDFSHDASIIDLERQKNHGQLDAMHIFA